jgi:branched-chain amino acid transport system substrate-binding protein
MVMLALGSHAMAAEPVKIGLQLPLSGLNAPLGQQALNGAEIAIEDVNKEGGVLGGELQLIVEDTESTPQAAMDGIHKLVDVDKVPVVLGEISSGRTIPTATYSTSHGVIHIGLASTSPDLRKIGKNFFNMVATDEVMGKAMVDVASRDTGKKNFGIIVMNDPYGVGIANEMTKAATAAGGKVVSTVLYEVNKTDYRAEVQRLFAPKPASVLSVSWGAVARVIQQQAWELGFAKNANKAWYSAYFSDSVSDCIPETCEGRKGLDIVPGDTERFNALRERIRQRAGAEKEVTWYSAVAYDAVRVTAEAIKKAGSKDSAALVKVFPEVFASYKGVSGDDLAVDADGVRKNQAYGTFIYHDGKIEPYKVSGTN